MFILTTIQDVIQIEPNDFGKPSRSALEDNINEKYANKVTLHFFHPRRVVWYDVRSEPQTLTVVIQQVGLCLCLYDLLSASDGLIGHGSGVVNVNVTFRMLVFRPFSGEIIEGKIISSTKDGIRVGLDFFDDITVPAPTALFDPSRFEAEGSVSTWVWTNEGVSYYFDKNERVRFRIEDEVWKDQRPGLREAMGGAARGAEGEGLGEQEQARADKSPWRLVGSMQQGGLGVVSWWMDVEGDGQMDEN